MGIGYQGEFSLEFRYNRHAFAVYQVRDVARGVVKHFTYLDKEIVAILNIAALGIYIAYPCPALERHCRNYERIHLQFFLLGVMLSDHTLGDAPEGVKMHDAGVQRCGLASALIIVVLVVENGLL